MPNLEEEILDPWTGFEDWYEKAHKLDLPNPNAALLATTNKVRPAARVVLIKDYAKETGFVFFTHYTSPKSRDLTANSHCCLVFFWDALALQIRIQGKAEKGSRAMSEEYFASRPRLSQEGAYISRQSKVLESRDKLVDSLEKFQTDHQDQPLSCPEHWGAWVIKPSFFEFWRGHEGRIHERLVFYYHEKQWKTALLYP